jgi:hypothetical protein
MVFFERSLLAIRFFLLKLGLAVLGALAAAEMLRIDDVLSPVFTALLCIKGTFFTGLAEARSQLSAALLGALLALASSAVGGKSALTLAAAVMLAAYLCVRFHWESHSLLVLFTLLYSYLLPIGTLGHTAVTRVEAVLVGITVATAINYLFSRFRYRRMYYFRLRHALEGLERALLDVAAAARAGDVESLAGQAQTIKSLARVVSLLYEESVDLAREVLLRKHAGGLTESLVPRIERLANRLESACWHLFGSAQSLLELLGQGGRIPPAAFAQFDAAARLTHEAVQALQNPEAVQPVTQGPAPVTRLPFFGLPLPEVTLLAELTLLTFDLTQLRFDSVRFVMELSGDDAV